MSLTTRPRARALSAVAVVAAALTVPVLLARPANAVTTTGQGIVFATDTAILRSDPDAMGQVGIAGLLDTSYVDEMSAAGDGSRVAYVQADDQGSSGSSFKLRERAQVRDIGGGLVRTLDDRSMVVDIDAFTFQGSSVSTPVLSPDGNTAVWGVTNFDLSSWALRKAVVAGGAPTTVTGGEDFSVIGFADASTLLGTDSNGNLATLPLAGGTTTEVANGGALGAVSVSADGTQIAYVTEPDGAELFVAPLSQQGGVWSVGTAKLLTSSVDTDEAPQFSHDGTTLYWAQNQDTGDTDLFSMALDGTAPVQLTTTSDVAEHSPVGIALDATPPGAATATPFTLAGTGAVLHWTLPADPDASGVLVHRTGGTAGDKLVFAPGTSYTDTGLKVGTTYSYELTTVDRSGNQATSSATRQLTALAPTATFPDPTSTKYYLNPNFRVYLPTVGSYTLQYRTNGAGPLSTWVSNGSGGSQVFSTARAGYSYGLLMTVHDSYGNSSAPTGVGTAVVPYDQTRATFTGSYATQALNDRYLGNATLLKAAAAAARLVVNGNRLQIVGERCASCGVMDVYVDGVRVAGIDTHQAYRSSRVVLYTRALSAGVNHTVVVKARGTSGHPNVVLDGFGVRH